MKGTRQSSFIRNTATLTFFSLLLSGCLMDDEVATDHDVSGSVGDGPIIGASLRILRNDGSELVRLESDSTAGYI
jgi:hypothetical protein